MIGKDIHIRILNESDLSKLTHWMNDPTISEIMGYLPVKTLQSQKDWYKAMMDNNSSYVFAICKNENSEYIGNVGLGKIDYINRHAMLNIFIADSENRFKGLGKQATKLALDFAFNRLNLNKVWLQTSYRFTEAIRLYKSIGFIKEGTLRQHYFSNGTYEDKVIFSILKSDLNSQK